MCRNTKQTKSKHIETEMRKQEAGVYTAATNQPEHNITDLRSVEVLTDERCNSKGFTATT